jgi:hypothetical protein
VFETVMGFDKPFMNVNHVNTADGAGCVIVITTIADISSRHLSSSSSWLLLSPFLVLVHTPRSIPSNSKVLPSVVSTNPVFSLSNNSITGTLPSSYGNWAGPSALSVDLSSNYLTAWNAPIILLFICRHFFPLAGTTDISPDAMAHLIPWCGWDNDNFFKHHFGVPQGALLLTFNVPHHCC